MNKSELRFPANYDAAAQRGLIRWQLFLHRDVRDVLPTSRPDTLQVLHYGEPDLSGWTAALAEESYPAPELVIDQATPTGAA